MSGRPEAVAKVLTLEACRIAHSEQRCGLFYFFGGSNEFRVHEQSLSSVGLVKVTTVYLNAEGGLMEPLVVEHNKSGFSTRNCPSSTAILRWSFFK
ncbi:hypothetical protein PM8797T_23359 [Gimesia maris DSM 8797]|nr:hypothetical protein PM8797T_23359 [Gimesia maris DSM 8797]